MEYIHMNEQAKSCCKGQQTDTDWDDCWYKEEYPTIQTWNVLNLMTKEQLDDSERQTMDGWTEGRGGRVRVPK